MAVNKNFVVKNGIEVNTNLIVADTDSNKVGIGTTVPEYTLHVFEGTGIGASMVYVTGISTSLEEFNVGVGGTTFTAISNAGAGIAGSVGVGTDLPGYLLEVHAPVSTGQTALFVRGDMHVTGDINLDDITLNELKVTGISTFENSIFVGSGATVGLNTVHFADHAKAMFGDGEDLKIYHDETSSYVDNSTGGVYIRNLSNDQDIFLQSDDGSGGVANYILCNGSSGQVELFHYGTARFNTNSIGVVATGTFESTGITTLASGGGISTTGGDLYIGGDLFVSDNITLDTNLNILGIATIATLRVSDTATGESGTEALIVGTGLSVRGSSTGVAVTLAGAGGITTTGGDFYVGGDLYISEDVILDTNLEIIGIATIGTLQVSSTSGINTILSTVESTSKDTGSLVLEGGLGIEKQLYVGAGASVGAGLTVAGDILPEADGTRDLGSSGAEFKDLYIDGTANIDSLSADTAAIGDLTDNRVVIAGTSGELEDSANLTFDGTTLTVGSGTGVTTILDEDNMASDSATALVTQQSIKAYVDAQITAEALDFAGDSGTGAVDLDSQSLTIAGTANEIETSASSQTLTIGLPDFVTVSNGLNVTGNGSTTTTLNVSGVSTFSDTLEIPSDSKKILLGAGKEMQVFHDGTDSLIKDTRNSGSVKIQADNFSVIDKDASETMLSATVDGAVELYHNNSKKFETGPAGTITVGVGTFDGLSLGDSEKALFGAGDDLEIYHNGTDSFIEDGSRHLLVRANGSGDLYLQSDSKVLLTDIGGNETFIECNDDSDVKLFHNNSEKLATTGAGVTVTGVTTSRGFVLAEDDGIHFRTTAADDLDAILRENSSNTLLINSRNDAILNIDSNNDSTDAHFAIGHGAATGSSTELFRVQEDGKIGIGQANPQGDLHIGNISGNKDIIMHSANNGTARLRFREGGSIDSGFNEYSIGMVGSGNKITVNGQGAGEIITILGDNGRVGIGSDAPISPLNILTSDDSVIVLKSTDANAYIAFNDSDSSSDFANRVGTVSDGLYFNTGGGGERFRITSTGAWAIEGASNYGTSGQVLTSNGNDAPTWQDASGGGAGGISTTHQQVQSTTATGISTFSTTEYRSAHMLVGITQGTSYQTGRYLIIHDNTTPTILEESALATGDMIATFDATISGGNLTVRVNMSNAGLATVAVKMDTIKSDSSS